MNNLNINNFNAVINPDDDEARAVAASNIATFIIPEGYKLAKIPKPHVNRSPIYDWGVCVVKATSDNEKGTLWFCRANSKCCSRRGISISGSNSNATRHLKEEHKIMSTKSGKLAAMAAVKADLASSGHYIAGLVIIKKLLPLSFFEDEVVRRAFSFRLPEYSSLQPPIGTPMMRSILLDLYSSTSSRIRLALAERASLSYLPPFHLHLLFWTDSLTKDKFLILYINYTSSRAQILAGIDQCKSFPLAIRSLHSSPEDSVAEERYATSLLSWVTQVLVEFDLSQQDIFSVSSNSRASEVDKFQKLMGKHRGYCVTEAVSNALKKAFGIASAKNHSKSSIPFETIAAVNQIVQLCSQSEELKVMFREVNASNCAACLNSDGEFPPQYWISMSKAFEVIVNNYAVIVNSSSMQIGRISLDLKVTADLHFSHHDRIEFVQTLLGPSADLISRAASFNSPRPHTIETLVNLTYLRLVSLETNHSMATPKRTVLESMNQFKDELLLPSAPVWGEDSHGSEDLSHLTNDYRANDFADVLVSAKRVMKEHLDHELFDEYYSKDIPDPAFLALDMQAMLFPKLRNLAYIRHLVKDTGNSPSNTMSRSEIYRNAVQNSIRNLAAQVYTARRQVNSTKGIAVDLDQHQAKRPRVQKSLENGLDRFSTLQQMGIMDQEECADVDNHDKSEVHDGLAHLMGNGELNISADERAKEELDRYLSGQGYLSKDLLLTEGLTFWMHDEICRLFPNLSAVAHAIFAMPMSTCMPNFKQGLGLSVRALRQESASIEEASAIEMLLFLHLNLSMIPSQLSGTPILPLDARSSLPLRLRAENIESLADL